MKTLKMLLILLVWFINVAKTKLKMKEAWIWGYPPNFIFLEDTFLNQQLAIRMRAKGLHVMLVKIKTGRSRYGRVFAFMAMPTPENVITGYIGKIKVEDRGTRGKEIIDACALTVTPTIPPGTITGYRADLLTFTNASGSAKTAAWKIVYNDLKALLMAFQLAANASQPNSITILQSGSFKIKNVGKKQKQVFSLANNIENGTIDLTGNVAPAKGKCLHDWWISFDLGKTYVRLDPTLESTTQATGLTIGAVIYFRHQYITPRGKDNGALETLFITVT
jgi:hypothetical protein